MTHGLVYPLLLFHHTQSSLGHCNNFIGEPRPTSFGLRDPGLLDAPTTPNSTSTPAEARNASLQSISGGATSRSKFNPLWVQPTITSVSMTSIGIAGG